MNTSGLNMFSPSKTTWRFLTPLLSAIALLLGLSFAKAANSTYTNAPVDNTWTNVNNWVSKVVPGQVNNTVNNGTDNSIATFNAPIALSGIGGAANPIITDDGTVSGGANGGAKARMLGGITFDTIDCGAYVFYVQSTPYTPGTTGGNPESGALLLCNGNSVLMNAAVTNRQTFLGPVEIRLPSSTTGTYNFVNNATSPNATLFMTNVFLYSGATGRGVTFILNGTNTGTNTMYRMAESPTASAAVSGITKAGTGNWIIAGPGTFRVGCPMNINEGTLTVKDPAGLGVVTSITVNSNGVLQADNITFAGPASMSLQGHGTFRMNGSGLIAGTTVGTAVGISATLATVSASDVLTNGNATLKVTSGGADSVLHSTGPGTILEMFTNNYAGRWSIDGGTNRITDPGAMGIGANINVGAGAVFDISPLGATTWVVTTLGIGGTGSGTGASAATILADPGAVINASSKAIALTFTPTAFSGDTTHPSLYMPQGTLSLANNTFTINNATGTPLGIGTYRLIQAASAVDGGGYVVSVGGSGTAFGTLGSIQVSGGNVNLVVASYTAKDLVWRGGNPNNNWDNGTTANFLNGASPSVFNTSDRVVFDSTGGSNPVVNLTTTLIPTSVTVNAVTNNYTFSGSGSVAGTTTTLAKIGPSNLVLNTVNTYAGGTVISNGVVKIGVNNALPVSGSGTVALYSPGMIDLNTFSNSIGGLSGNGTVDNLGGGTATLTLGGNDTSGTFSGTIKNTAGTLAVMKNGLGAQTLSSSNSFVGGTVINNGTLRVGNYNALGIGTSNNLVINGGILDMQTDLYVSQVSGGAGFIENDSTANLNTLVVQNATNASATYSGVIGNGAGGGSVAVKIISGTLTLGGGNTYTGGTYVGENAGFGIPNSPAGVIGFLIASNNSTLALSGGSGTPGTPTNITTVDGATVMFNAGALGKIWGGQFTGSANTTNRYQGTPTTSGAMSFGGDSSFKSFFGIVSLEMNGNARFINIPAGSYGGGDAAIFLFATDIASNACAMTTRDAAQIRLGEIRGGSLNAGIDTATTAGVIDTYVIGGKNTDFRFEGYIRGSNNIVKAGTGTMTIDGYLPYVTNGVDSVDFNTWSNVTYTSYLTYGGNTVVSNGVLKLIAPNNVSSNSPIVTMAGSTATLDVSSAGYGVSQFDVTKTDPFPQGLVTNSFVVTNGTLTLQANGAGPGQILNGFGTINGRLLAPLNSIVTPGLPFGTLTVTTNVQLNGLVTVNISATNTPNCGELASPTINVGGTASLIITNLGPEYSATFQLFNHAVSFTSVTLPPTTGTNSWVNNLAVNGSITLLAPAAPTVNTNAFSMSAVYSGNSIALSWPPDRMGFRLQVQTNSLSTGISTNWVDVSGSTAITNTTIILNPLNPTVFYRLIYP